MCKYIHMINIVPGTNWRARARDCRDRQMKVLCASAVDGGAVWLLRLASSGGAAQASSSMVFRATSHAGTNL